jgi:diacylglycerol kinase (ATP)
VATTRIILNPTADKGRAGTRVPTVEAELEARGIEAELIQTRHPGHAIELATQAARDNIDVVVAAGGDGTANEVLNGLMAVETRPAMAVLPIGRGNDFAFGMGIPGDLAGACDVLQSGFRRTIDVGHVAGGEAVGGDPVATGLPNGRYFGNGVGIGFDAIVGFEAAKLRFVSGFLGYIVAALKTITLYHRGPVVTLDYFDAATQADATLRMQLLMVSIMNGRRMGGGFMMAPDGDPSDGVFHLCLAAQMRRANVLGMIPHFMNGTQAGHAGITNVRTQRIVVTAAEGTLPAHADGETLCKQGERLELTLLPAQLQVVTRDV